MQKRREQVRYVRSERLPTMEELSWLRSEAGRSVCAAMAAGETADSPATIARWRERLEPELVSAAWMQVTLRQAATVKFSRASEMLFDRVALEQASDEVIAEHKARRFTGIGRVVDFCCGIGGDSIALAGQCTVTAVDWSRTRLAMAEHNAGVYGQRIEARVGDVELDRPEADAVHIDPDRRSTGRRLHSIDAASPGLETIDRIVKRYANAAIKLSPGADFDMLPFAAEVELISHHGECKQAVLWTGGFKKVYRRATVLVRSAECGVRIGGIGKTLLTEQWHTDKDPHSPPQAGEGTTIVAMDRDEMGWPEVRAVEAGQWLYEPDAAVIRADLVGVLARKYELGPVDSRISYLVGDKFVATSLMKSFRVIDRMEWSLKRARAWLVGHHVGSLEVKTRGFAARPEEVIKQLRLRGNGRAAVLFLTRVGEKPLAILAVRNTRTAIE